MFKGRYLHTLDAKGRLSVPSRFREVLARHREETLILTNFDIASLVSPPMNGNCSRRRSADFPCSRRTCAPSRGISSPARKSARSTGRGAF